MTDKSLRPAIDLLEQHLKGLIYAINKLRQDSGLNPIGVVVLPGPQDRETRPK